MLASLRFPGLLFYILPLVIWFKEIMTIKQKKKNHDNQAKKKKWGVKTKVYYSVIKLNIWEKF